MEIYETIFLVVSSSATSLLSAVVGMAGGIVLLSLMTFVMPVSQLIPLHGVIQLVSNSSRTFFLRKSIIKPVFFFFLLGLPFGTWSAVQILKSLSDPSLPLFLILLLILYTLFKPKKMPEIKLPFWTFFLVGFSVGLLGPFVGATGPFLAPFFLRDDFNKEQTVATLSSVQTVGHMIKIPAFLYLGFPYFDFWLLLILMSLATVLGSRIGVALLHKIDEKVFKLLFRGGLVFAGLRVAQLLFLKLS